MKKMKVMMSRKVPMKRQDDDDVIDDNESFVVAEDNEEIVTERFVHLHANVTETKKPFHLFFFFRNSYFAKNSLLG